MRHSRTLPRRAEFSLLARAGNYEISHWRTFSPYIIVVSTYACTVDYILPPTSSPTSLQKETLLNCDNIYRNMIFSVLVLCTQVNMMFVMLL
jgi:hypothetical protein